MNDTSSPLQTSEFATVAETVGPAVVTIGRDRRGSGLIVAAGAVLTNAHNLRDATTTVTFADGTTAAAELRAADADGDLVVLSVDTGDRPAVTWTESDPPELGTRVLAVTRSGTGVRVTDGRVTAVQQSFRGPRGRVIGGGLEHAAPVPRGGSGSPIADRTGAVLGINTHRLDGGFYLALPADDALRQRVDGLLSGESVARRRLGVGLAPAHVARRLRRSVGLPDRDGLLVRMVQDDSPAAAAGLQKGDLLVSAAGDAIDSVEALHGVLDRAEAGTPVVIGLVRGADELTVEVTFAE